MVSRMNPVFYFLGSKAGDFTGDSEMFVFDIGGINGLFGLVREGNGEDWFFEVFCFTDELITGSADNSFAID